MLNDLAWFFFLYSVPPFSVWLTAIGLAILWDEREEPPFPRWSAYLNLWQAFLLLPAVAMIFFKDGPLAYSGVIAFYIPTIAFFCWLSIMAYLGITATKRPEGQTA